MSSLYNSLPPLCLREHEASAMEAAQAPLFPSTRTEHKKSVGLRGLEGKIQHATSLVNAYLSRKDLPEMNLGALKDMPGIRQKACKKLAQPQKQVAG